MGLCARAQRLEQHERTEESAMALSHALWRSPRQIRHSGISTPSDRGRHGACRASTVGAVEAGCRLERSLGKCGGKTMSIHGTPAALEKGWQLREISYM